MRRGRSSGTAPLFFTSALKVVTSFTPRQLYPGGNPLCIHWLESWLGPREGLGMKIKILHLSGFELEASSPPHPVAIDRTTLKKRFDFRQRKKNYVFSPQRSDQFWGPPRLSLECYRGLYSRKQSGQSVRLRTHHLVSRLKKRGVIPPLPYTSPQRDQ
jgi:hypothetical protein